MRRHSNMCIVLLFLSVIAMSQFAYDKAAPPFRTKLETARRDLLPDSLLPYIHFGFNVFLADMYWIRTIQDYVAWDNKELFFLDYFKNISVLDPKFEHPYLFAIWTIPSNKNIERLDKVAEVAQRGIDVIPTSWRIPYNLGTQYYLFTKTYSKAKEYLKLAAEKENAPPGVYLNYSSFVINDVRGYKASYDLVKVIYDTTSDVTLKKVLELGLEKELLATMLERGIVAYKTTTGKYPASLEDLIAKDFVSFPETFLERFTVTINRYNGSFKVEERRK
ncbi:MAG: hypothetical protein KBC21_04600 [Candidatus Pacebacteria bacterium]|nr:hypothetical protein [Candidatus Paceibacterota bacterium]